MTQDTENTTADSERTANGGSEALVRYRRALARTHGLIDPYHQRSPTLADVQALATARLDRLRAFLRDLGNPERAVPVIHVAGTSGKGSTATMIAAVLTASGYRTGLHTSPYVQVATEKLQIDGELISAGDFAALVDETLRLAERSLGDGRLTYGELWAAMSFRWFADQGVDAAVIEVGAGGRFDLTNVVSPLVSVITSIGLDHTETLGPTLQDVAWHKAGIIKPNVPVVTAVTEPAALATITDEALRNNAPVTVVRPGEMYHLDTDAGGAQFLETHGHRWQVPGGTSFQAANTALALAVVDQLAGFGPFDPKAIAAGLEAARVPGRAELVQRNPDVLLDGAHNPQKIAALVAGLPQLIERGSKGRLVALVGSLDSKRQSEMFSPLLEEVDELVVTEQPVPGKRAMPAEDIASQARRAGFRGAIHQEPVVSRALELALSLLDAHRGDSLLVTGSLFLVGSVRATWYPDDQIVLQQTPWPDVANMQR